MNKIKVFEIIYLFLLLLHKIQYFKSTNITYFRLQVKFKWPYEQLHLNLQCRKEIPPLNSWYVKIRIQLFIIHYCKHTSAESFISCKWVHHLTLKIFLKFIIMLVDIYVYASIHKFILEAFKPQAANWFWSFADVVQIILSFIVCKNSNIT